jgi:hypothetical protein
MQMLTNGATITTRQQSTRLIQSFLLHTVNNF